MSFIVEYENIYSIKLDEDSLLTLISVLNKVYENERKPGFLKRTHLTQDELNLIEYMLTSLVDNGEEGEQT